VAATTQHGLAQGPDSAVYLGTAHALTAGHGPSVPFTFYWDRFAPQTAVNFHGYVPSSHFPPGYPIALAVSSSLAGSVLGAARLLDVVLVAINVFLVALLAARLTSYRSAVAATAPALLLTLYPDRISRHAFPFGWMTVHQSVASEPLFMTLFTTALLVAPFAFVADRRRARVSLVALGAVSGAALLTRYAGIALVLTFCLALVVLDSARPLARRALRVAVFVVCALAPTLAYLLWAAVRGGGAARTLFYYPNHGDLSSVMEWFGRFLLPPVVPGAPRTGVLILVLLGLALAVVAPALIDAAGNERDAHDVRLLARLTALSLPCYVLVLLASRAFLDARVPLDPISALPNGALLASNAPEVLWDATDRASVVLPSRYDYLSNEINPRYDLEIHDMASILARRHGYVYLTVTLTPTAGPVELERYATLVLVEQTNREALYRVEPRH